MGVTVGLILLQFLFVIYVCGVGLLAMLSIVAGISAGGVQNMIDEMNENDPTLLIKSKKEFWLVMLFTIFTWPLVLYDLMTD